LNLVLQFIYRLKHFFGESLNGILEIIECKVYDKLQFSYAPSILLQRGEGGG